MIQTKIIMGMPITLEIVAKNVSKSAFNKVFTYFRYIDRKFSTYKKTSEVSKINCGSIKKDDYSNDMKRVLLLSEKTKRETGGYFDILTNGELDPSGLVKGWAIYNASRILENEGYSNFYIDAGGDIQAVGLNKNGKPWRVGIKNPLNDREIVKVLCLTGKGVATSGTYIRGQHIFNPVCKNKNISEIVSLTVVGQNIYDADRFATAAFAMEANGIRFIENLDGLEAYMIDTNGVATYTSGFNQYTKES